jgi:hypothetical protein
MKRGIRANLVPLVLGVATKLEKCMYINVVYQ